MENNSNSHSVSTISRRPLMEINPNQITGTPGDSATKKKASALSSGAKRVKPAKDEAFSSSPPSKLKEPLKSASKTINAAITPSKTPVKGYMQSTQSSNSSKHR